MKTNNIHQSGFFLSLKGISLILLFAFSVSFISCEEEVNDVNMEVGDAAPAFSLTSSKGAVTMLSDFSNKVVVLFFLGNNCPSCKAAAPSVESMLVTPYAKRSDYMLIGLDQWDGNAASVEAFKTSTGLSVPILLNASAVAKAYGTTFDRLVVVDQMGKIAFVGKQGVSADIAAAKSKVESLLGNAGMVPVGDAPAFTLSSTAGSSVSLSDYSNKVRVLFFFGNNCPPCKAAAPSIESMLVTPFASRTDYVVLGLDQWNGNLASVNSFRTSTNVTFPLLLNAATVATSYGTTYDRILVVDKAGNIVFKGTQGVASDLAAVKTKVNTLLGL